MKSFDEFLNEASWPNKMIIDGEQHLKVKERGGRVTYELLKKGSDWDTYSGNGHTFRSKKEMKDYMKDYSPALGGRQSSQF